MSNLETMKTEILADGIVDASEVENMRTVLFEDGVIDKDEMQFLVDIADEVDGNQNDPSFLVLYMDAVRNRYLEDEVSPGSIDKEEANEIIEMFWGDGTLNSYERSALEMLNNEATEIHANLKEKMEFLGM